MIYLLLGNNPIAKNNYLQQELEKLGSDLVRFRSPEHLPDLNQLGGSALFGKPQSYAFENLLTKLDLEALLSLHQDSDTPIFLLETSLDKRKKDNKNLLANTKIIQKEFLLPEATQAQQWLNERILDYQLKMNKQAINYMLEAVTAESGELDVVRLENELQKLVSYLGSETQELDVEDVRNLVYKQNAVDVWQLADLIAAKNRPATLKFLENYFRSQKDEPKSVAISLGALLSEQLRSIWLVKSALDEGVSEQQILADTGWKSGRLFVVRKKVNNFTSAELKTLLFKLESLDKELKSSTMPHEVILNLIFAQ